MQLRVPDARRKIIAFVSLLGLQAGLAAGPLRSGAASEPIRPAVATRPAAPAAPVAPVASLAGTPTAPTVAEAPAAAPVPALTAAAAALVPQDRLHLQPLLEQAAQQSGLPSDVVLAQAWAESSWRVDAASNVGAVGVLQLTPDTVDFVSKRLLHLDQNLDALDPTANAHMATVYLRHLLEQTDGDLRQALIAYNQGLRSLYRDGPVPEAEAYADRVLALRPVFASGP